MGPCFAGIAFANKNPYICNQTGGDYRDECYRIIAYLNKNLSLCLEVSGWNRYKCTYLIGLITGDLNICNSVYLPEEISFYDAKKTCELGVAISKNDISYCKSNKTINEGRIATSKTDCFKEIAVNTKNEDLCKEIEINTSLCNNGDYVDCEHMMYEGRDDCYYNVAPSKRDLNICDNIKDETSLINCVLNVIKRDQYFPNLCVCDNIKNMDLDRKNSTILKEMFELSCYELVAEYSGNLDICDKMKNLSYLDKYTEVPKEYTLDENDSVSERNIKLLISSFYDKISNCYSSVAIEKADLDICNKIENEAVKEYCKEYVNKKLDKINICNNLKDQELKNECICALNSIN
jgi:hypothetical protein